MQMLIITCCHSWFWPDLDFPKIPLKTVTEEHRIVTVSARKVASVRSCEEAVEWGDLSLRCLYENSLVL